jgi:hypothetical protein
VVIACYGMSQLNHPPSCRMQDRLDIRLPNVVFATSSNRRPMEFERKSEQNCIERGKRLFAACLFLSLRTVDKFGQADY